MIILELDGQLTAVEALHLAQQATLETREAKHEPRSLAEQRTTWFSEAAVLLGGRGAVTSMVQTALARPAETATIADVAPGVGFETETFRMWVD
jgi:hypothetical protein